jgi:hypothetical protein
VGVVVEVGQRRWVCLPALGGGRHGLVSPGELGAKSSITNVWRG